MAESPGLSGPPPRESLEKLEEYKEKKKKKGEKKALSISRRAIRRSSSSSSWTHQNERWKTKYIEKMKKKRYNPGSRLRRGGCDRFGPAVPDRFFLLIRD